MLRSRSSSASARVSTSAGALVAAWGPWFRSDRLSAELVRLTIAPPLRRCRAASRLTAKVARVLIRTSASNSSRLALVAADAVIRLPTGVDYDVDAAERGDRLGEEPVHVQIVRDVGADGHGVAVAREDRFDDRLGRTLVVQVVDHDRVAVGRQAADRRPAPSRAFRPRLVGLRTRGPAATRERAGSARSAGRRSCRSRSPRDRPAPGRGHR